MDAAGRGHRDGEPADRPARERPAPNDRRPDVDELVEQRSRTRFLVAFGTVGCGALGIALQQLSTDRPANVVGWLMLITGWLLAGAGALFATDLFDRFLRWLAKGWSWLRRQARWRLFLLPTLAGLLALLLGFGLPQPVAALAVRIAGCPFPTELRVLTSPDSLPAVRHLLDQYGAWTARQQHGCAKIHGYAYAVPPEAQRRALVAGWSVEFLRDVGPRPDLWFAESSVQLDQVRADAQQIGVRVPFDSSGVRTLATTPLVIAAQAGALPPELRAQRRDRTWSQLLASLDTLDWNLVRPEPSASLPGQVATAALYVSTGALTDPAAARGLESRLAGALDRSGYPLGGVADLLCQHRRGAAARTALILPEQSLIGYNRGTLPGAACGAGGGPPGEALVAVYPTNGYDLDLNFVPLRLLPTSPPANAAVDAFGAWLATDAGRDGLLATGWRPADQFAVGDPLTEANGVLPGAPYPHLPPPARVADQAAQRQAQARRPVRLLLAVDSSGSMQGPVAGTTRYALTAAAVAQVVRRLSDTDQLGLWTFPAEGAPTAPRELLAITGGGGPVGPDRPAVVAGALAGVRPAGSTPVLATIVGGVRALGTREPGSPDGDVIRALVVLTDGEDNASGLTGEQVLDGVTGRGVRVFVVAVGEARCGSVLAEVARRTGGACQETTFDTVGAALDLVFGVLVGGSGA